MRRADRLDIKASELYFISCVYRPQVTMNPVLFQLVFHQTQRQSGSVNRDVNILQQIRDCTDMVFVTVRNYHSDNPVFIRQKIGKIGDDDINSVHFVIRERKPAVYNHNLFLTFEECHVFSDLIQSPDWDYP